MNILDKAISTAFPEWAVKRAAARHNLKVFNEIQPGYKGGMLSRQRGRVLSSTQREDQSTNGSYRHLIAAAMNLYRNEPMTRSIVDVVATYMGESHPMAATTDPEFNREATEYFNEVFWPFADARRRPGVDFGTIQSVWTKWSFIGGDMLFSLMDGALYPYEGLQISTPYDLKSDQYVVNGVRLERKAPNRITHYYVGPADQIMRMAPVKEYSRIRQQDAIFAPSKYWRAAMLRGVPELHGVVDALQDCDEVNQNIQGLIKLQSSIWTIERKGSIGNLPGHRLLSVDTTDGEQVEYTKADYGMRFKVNGSPRDDLIMNKIDNPGNTHVAYMEYVARVISAGVGLPMEMVLHLFTNGSYTANRAARTDFAKFVTDRWQWRNKVLNQRVWNWKIAQAIKGGEIRPAPLDSRGLSQWHRCTWTLPHFPQIDEGKEIVADIKQWQTCVTSLADLAQEQGRTMNQLLDAHDADIREMQARAEGLGISLDQYANQLFSTSAVKEQENNEE